jgi:transposase-like protein
MAKRTNHSATFKAKAALAALRENKTLSELSQEFKIHAVQIAKYKSIAAEGLVELFESKRGKKKRPDIDIEALYAQIGKLQSQLEFLKKKTGIED